MNEDSACFAALSLISNGDWNGAHDIVQNLGTKEAAQIHALLHRIEGDIANARYWYKRASVPFFQGTTDEELKSLLSAQDR